MSKNSIASALGCLILISLISGCTKPDTIAPPVEVRTITKPAPIVPKTDQLKMRKIEWIVITPQNVDEKIASVKNGNGVLFALTDEGYKNILLNNSDVLALVEQQKIIIAIYERSYK